MIETYDLAQLVRPALDWFYENRRILPWREGKNPYHIWVSEIMLQQTRVEAVKPYYERFLGELPDIASLADCPEDRLLKLWEGLGYYNRVRNMQKAAREIMERWEGKMPEHYPDILSLPGIGPYTAGAVASIAFGEAVPAVDGNVLRILARASEDDSDILKASTKRRFTEALSAVMPEKEPGDFNQSLMEIGALVCVPNGDPHCENVPGETSVWPGPMAESGSFRSRSRQKPEGSRRKPSASSGTGSGFFCTSVRRRDFWPVFMSCRTWKGRQMRRRPSPLRGSGGFSPFGWNLCRRRNTFFPMWNGI